MMTITEYVVFWMIVFCGVGVVCYLVDSRFAGRLRTSWHNVTHEHPLTPEEMQGFLYRRNFSARLRAAVFIGVVGSLIVVFKTERPMAGIFLWIPAIGMVFLGFKLAPLIERLWRSRQKAMHALEKFETEGIDVKKGTQAAVQYVQHRVSEAIHHGHQHHHPPIATPDVIDERPPLSSEEPHIDPRELIRRFTHRK